MSSLQGNLQRADVQATLGFRFCQKYVLN